MVSNSILKDKEWIISVSGCVCIQMLYSILERNNNTDAVLAVSVEIIEVETIFSKQIYDRRATVETYIACMSTVQSSRFQT